MARCEDYTGCLICLNNALKYLNTREYILIMLNMLEYISLYLNKQSSEYARILNMCGAVHSMR